MSSIWSVPIPVELLSGNSVLVGRQYLVEWLYSVSQELVYWLVDRIILSNNSETLMITNVSIMRTKNCPEQ